MLLLISGTFSKAQAYEEWKKKDFEIYRIQGAESFGDG
jgi:hypothetical protein